MANKLLMQTPSLSIPMDQFLWLRAVVLLACSLAITHAQGSTASPSNPPPASFTPSSSVQPPESATQVAPLPAVVTPVSFPPPKSAPVATPSALPPQTHPPFPSMNPPVSTPSQPPALQPASPSPQVFPAPAHKPPAPAPAKAKESPAPSPQKAPPAPAPAPLNPAPTPIKGPEPAPEHHKHKRKHENERPHESIRNHEHKTTHYHAPASAPTLVKSPPAPPTPVQNEEDMAPAPSPDTSGGIAIYLNGGRLEIWMRTALTSAVLLAFGVSMF